MRLWPLAAVAAACLLVACRTPTAPKNVSVVKNFNVKRYLGTWYEIARLDNRFEKNLEQVTATYSLKEDGDIRVLNRGYDPARQRWKESEGTARFTGSTRHAALKVSFFGPFWGGYNVIALDKHYQHALVCGPNRSWLWILSRSPRLDAQTRNALVQQAQRQGFDVSQLRWIKQPPSASER
ncbi:MULTISPECIES: outer membrane lipoprotein Blc [Tenebrionibacter/Tenebrionicola group]|jgi:apolipoprotein D and lipocalin family protein|uniref:Outer membrane lipoprotein Blc n=2 Tax=Tenebrionibacter/Tenebrionicola group TaxID=2969848 RepID=A0A8K0V597_9ENTR|nr:MULTISPECIES: outer membrane lipoprotein Blc [Tenebrionibacter/Tenebrionicola group]MBK4716001.1 outer membrane lipoprotein Blc [Tenebrionibacter intestinalis]MBV4413563.1 outer membrane lipoprotein Blc [Tenebrionicola larvae]MBV5096168.1 outer membrane lipoprotein Blc [Tenebrionicola larvae]